MARRLLAAAGTLAAAYTVGGHLVARAKALRRRPDRPDAVALTFDDGPDPSATPRVLECLAREQATATFFMVGRRAEAHPDVAREVMEAGHEVGNHTYSHRHLWTAGPWRTAREIRDGTAAIAEATGREPVAFRPPWGLFNAAAQPLAAQLGQPSVLWSIRSEGLIWRPSAQEMLEHIVAHTRGGDILNLHDAGGFPDTPQRVLTVLPDLLLSLRDAGLRLVPLSDLL